MANFEKFGSFLLLEEVGADCLGRVYRAAKLGQVGLDKVVYLTKIGQSLAQNAPLMKSLVDELKISAQITSPNIAKVYGCGKLEGAYFISWEFIEGKDLGVVFTRMGEGFPLAMDQNLYIISRVVAALETAHNLKVDDRAVIHGALSPVDVLVTYEGDVKVKNFSIAPVLSKMPSERKEAYRKIETYLSPEVLDGQMPDKRSDIYALGLIFYRLLTGEPVFTGTRDIDLKQRLDSSLMMTPHNDEDRIPGPVAEIIMRCLQTNPAKRFASVKELKQAIEAAMLAGDINPSTFNLAFFMHTAFRSEIETETKAIQEEKSINFLQYIEPPAKAAAPEAAQAAAGAATVATPAAAAPSAEADKKAPAAPRKPAAPTPAPSFMAEPEKKKSPVLLIVVALAVVGIGIGAYVMLKPAGPAKPPSGAATPAQLSPEQQAKLAQIEKEKIDAEQRTQALLQEMETLKQQLDAAQKKDEKEKLLKEFEAKRQLAAQAEKEKAAIDAQAATIKKAVEEQAPAGTTPATSLPGSETTGAQGGPPAVGSTPSSGSSAGPADGGTTTGGATPSVQPPTSSGGTTGQPAVGSQPVAAPVSGVKEGDLVSFDSCDVKPKITRPAMPAFPPVAKKVGVSGTVVVSVLITETGAVAEARVKKPSGSKYGFDEEAMKAAKKYQFSPGMKEGKRVKVWYELPAFVFQPSK